MNQVVAIAVNTFKETIRDRVLAVIVVFALLMIVGGIWLGSISLGQQGRMMQDFGLVAVTAFGLIVAVFVAAGLVHKEVEKRTVFVLFSKPVSRAAFITGKFIGLCGTMGLVLAGMGGFLFLGIVASLLFPGKSDAPQTAAAELKHDFEMVVTGETETLPALAASTASPASTTPGSGQTAAENEKT